MKEQTTRGGVAVNGPNTVQLYAAGGISAFCLRKYLSEPLNVADTAIMRVNGHCVHADFQVTDGDAVDFRTRRGLKGGDYYSEGQLRKLGVTAEWIDNFCRAHPAHCHRDNDNRCLPA